MNDRLAAGLEAVAPSPVLPLCMRKVGRIAIWIAIAVSLVRGLESFDSGGSANNLVTIGAALTLSAALMAAAIMFCFDRER